MIFSSITFLFYFLPTVLLLYHFTPDRYKNAVLFLASLFFYAWGEPVYVLVMLFSTVTDYSLGRGIGYFREQIIPGGNPNARRNARFCLCASLFINLSLLLFFKYSNLFLSTAAGLLSLDFAPFDITLPIGISFYTFQTMSYSIDVYRGKVRPQKSFIDFGAFVTLFPQLIAGPIVLYETIEKELSQRRSHLEKGIPLFIMGLSQKVLLANQMGLVWEEVKRKSFAQLAPSTAWIGLLAYAFQVYFDFCGYSNMAIGLGEMLGFHFPVNFNKPYSSKSITEFWRRWHISLSAWFREYVYIPLGGNRRGILIQLRNILMVWLLTGLWHGASWNFLFWGLYFALLLILEKLFLKDLLLRLPGWIRHVYTMFAVLMGWVLFVFEQPGQIWDFLQALFRFGRGQVIEASALFLVFNNLLLFLACILISSEGAERLTKRLIATFCGKSPTLSKVRSIIKGTCLMILFLLSIAYIVDSSYNPFLYFRF